MLDSAFNFMKLNAFRAHHYTTRFWLNATLLESKLERKPKEPWSTFIAIN